MSLRIGLIGGTGHWAYVLDGVKAIEGARLCAVAPGAADESMDAVLRHPVTVAMRAAVYADYRALLARERLDMVGLAPYFYLHAEICVAALERGVAPFCEKPLALETAALERVVAAQARAGLPIGMMLPFRYEPMFFTAHRLVRAGAIGAPTVGYAQKSYKLGVRPAWYAKRETFGGIIPWVGVHAMDWFQWVSGRRYTAVTARHANLHTPQYPGLEDHAACLFELDNGGSAVMSFDFLRPAGAPTHGDDRLRLVGATGVLDIRWPHTMDVLAAAGPQVVTLEKPALGPLADFARSLTDRTHACLVSTADALQVSALALQVRAAADRGARVEL